MIRYLDSELLAILLEDLAAVAGGMVSVGGECIAGCPGRRPGPPGSGITAEELWRDQLNRPHFSTEQLWREQLNKRR